MNDKALLLVLLSLLFNTCLPAQTADSLSGFAINTLPYFADSLNLSSPNQRKAINAFLQLKKPQLPEGQNLNDNWAFANGSPSEGAIASSLSKPQPDTTVDLPHRILLPNHPLWYQKTIVDSPAGVLFIDADDGAQLFANAQPVASSQGYFYFLPQNSPDSLQLTIRVLNNAMKGGLRRALLLSQDQYRHYTDEKDTYERLKTLLRQLLDKDSISSQELEVYLAAVQYPGRRLRKVEESSSPLMAGPYLQRTAEGQWVVMMETRPGQAAPVLRWGSSHGAVDRPLEGAYHDNYWAFALPPEANACDTAYYQPVINGEAGPIAAIARRESVPFTFTAWGDSQGGWRVFREHNRQMAQSHPHFTIGLGDLVDDGVNTWQWRAMLHCLQPLASQSPVYFIPGNHDYDGYYDSLYSANYHRYSAWPNYYSWVYGNAIFLALDPNQNFPLGIDSTQEHWLETVIQSEPWRNARWRFVLLHQPPYAQGWPGYHGDGFIRQLADSLAEPAGIDFVLSGHCHDFERLTKNYGRQQTHFIVLGGAGGSLEPPESSDAPVMDKVVKDYHYGQFRVGHEKVSFQAIGLDGQLLDDITFEKRQP